MRETNRVWHPIRALLAPYGTLQRVETPGTGIGVPDVFYALLGVQGALELKVGTREGRAPPHLTREQLAWATTWTRPPASGLWHLILRTRADGSWLVYDAAGARRLIEGEGSSPIIKTSGLPPAAMLLAILAPTGLRTAISTATSTATLPS